MNLPPQGLPLWWYAPSEDVVLLVLDGKPVWGMPVKEIERHMKVDRIGIARLPRAGEAEPERPMVQPAAPMRPPMRSRQGFPPGTPVR